LRDVPVLLSATLVEEDAPELEPMRTTPISRRSSWTWGKCHWRSKQTIVPVIHRCSPVRSVMERCGKSMKEGCSASG